MTRVNPKRTVVFSVLIALFLGLVVYSAVHSSDFIPSGPRKISRRHALWSQTNGALLGKPFDLALNRYLPPSVKRHVLSPLTRRFGIGAAFPLSICLRPRPGALRIVTYMPKEPPYTLTAKLYDTEGKELGIPLDTENVSWNNEMYWQQYSFQDPPTNQFLVVKILESESYGLKEIATFRFENPRFKEQ